MHFAPPDEGTTPPLPVDQPGMEHFPSLDVTRVRTENFMATVTAYTYKDPKGPLSKYMFRPTGGAISALWLKGLRLSAGLLPDRVSPLGAHELSRGRGKNPATHPPD